MKTTWVKAEAKDQNTQTGFESLDPVMSEVNPGIFGYTRQSFCLLSCDDIK